MISRFRNSATRALTILSVAVVAAFAMIPELQAQAPRKAVILSINDVYRIEGVHGGKLGGMARVRALRIELEKISPDLLFLHAGDFLSPSFLGRTYKGAQMIDLMNVMDGDPAPGSHDERMFVAFGNHEFDDTHCTKEGPLADLVTASDFTWLASNLDFTRCGPLKALDDHKKISAGRIVESGGLRVGLFGVTMAYKKYAAIVKDPIKATCEETKALRAKGADVVVALTHFPWQEDLELLGLGPDAKPLSADKRACKDAPDIVIGGHDHHKIALPSREPRLFKADADAVSAWVIEITKPKTGDLRIDARLVLLDESTPRDAFAERLAAMWRLRHDERFCTADCIGKPKGERRQCLKAADSGHCLLTPVARTASDIETEEITNRSFETGFGNWVADQVREAGRADVAIINAGAIRLNYTLKAGTQIIRRHLEQMFPFRNKLVVRQVPAKALWQAMQRALDRRGEGAWAHFSGMAVRVAVENRRQIVKQIRVRRADGTIIEVPRDSDKPVTIASLSFTLANGDKHGFRLCPGIDDMWACKDALEKDTRWPLSGDGSDLAGFVRQILRALPGELTLAKDGRLCDPGQKNCLIDSWPK